MKPRVRILVISRSPKLHPQIPPEGAIQLRVGVEARGGQAPVAEHLLHKVGRGAAARRGRVLELVRGDVFSDILRTGASPDVAPELTAGERAVCLLRAEYGVARRTESFEGFRVAKRNEDMPGGGRKEHRAHLLALAVARDLAGGVSFEGAALLKAAPVEAGDFRDVGAADEEAALALTRSSCAYCQPRRGPL